MRTLQFDEHKKSRSELAGYFVKNAIPTEANFSDFISSGLNQRDDGVAKPAGGPLSVASVDQSGAHRVLDLYADFGADTQADWSITIRSGDADGLAVASEPDDTVRLFVERATGRVGIGTTIPQFPLDVRGSIAAGTSDIYFTDSEHNHSGIGNQTGSAAIENATDYDELMILGRSTRTGRMIGMWDAVTVHGDLTVEGTLSAGSTTTNVTDVSTRNVTASGVITPSVGAAGGIEFPHDPFGGGGDNAWIRYLSRGGESTTLEIGIANDPDDHINLNASGNVGISTANPIAKLDVNGSYRFTGTNLSDRNLKQDIEEASYGLAEVRGLRPVAFRWRDRPSEPKTLGLVAQDVQGVVDAVVSSDEGGTLGISYTGMIAVLIKAIQELDDEVTALRAAPASPTA